jgi:hypothetical protein
VSVLSAGEATALAFIAKYRDLSPQKTRRVLEMLKGDAKVIADRLYGLTR